MVNRWKTGARRGTVGSSALVLALASLCLGLLGWTPSAAARDVSLGGSRIENRGHKAPNELKAQLPANVVALPRVVAYVQDHNTGRWKRVLVDAYLAPTDSHTGNKMRSMTKDIAERIRPQLEAQPAELLQAAYQGPKAARDCIRQAAEETLGRSWNGEVLIRSLAVF